MAVSSRRGEWSTLFSAAFVQSRNPMGLLDAVESQQIPRSDLTAFTARQLLNLKDERLTARVRAAW